MEKHKCKFCLRIFANGRALGGHIRSHMVNLCTKSRISPNSKGPKKRIRKSRISETFHQNPSGKTGKLPESSSSISEEEEDVAYSLMMLSKDKWTRDKEVKTEKKKGKYRCETCIKVFRSYQALGGHRASHKKIKVLAKEEEIVGEENRNKENGGEKNEKIHECPICYRVFSSGQALGGHKRSHFTEKLSCETGPAQVLFCTDSSVSASLASTNFENQGLSRTGKTLIDLNLPAPTDDDDEEEEEILSIL